VARKTEVSEWEAAAAEEKGDARRRVSEEVVVIGGERHCCVVFCISGSGYIGVLFRLKREDCNGLAKSSTTGALQANAAFLARVTISSSFISHQPEPICTGRKSWGYVQAWVYLKGQNRFLDWIWILLYLIWKVIQFKI